MLKKIGRRHKERIVRGGSETTTFLLKWKRNQGKTDLTGKFIKYEDLASYMFAHGLPKGMYPEFRNNINNIVFVDNIEQHHRVDQQIAGKKYLVQQLVLKNELIPRLKKKWDFFSNKQKKQDGKIRSIRTIQTGGV